MMFCKVFIAAATTTTLTTVGLKRTKLCSERKALSDLTPSLDAAVNAGNMGATKTQELRRFTAQQPTTGLGNFSNGASGSANPLFTVHDDMNVDDVAGSSSSAPQLSPRRSSTLPPAPRKERRRTAHARNCTPLRLENRLRDHDSPVAPDAPARQRGRRQEVRAEDRFQTPPRNVVTNLFGSPRDRCPGAPARQQGRGAQMQEDDQDQFRTPTRIVRGDLFADQECPGAPLQVARGAPRDPWAALRDEDEDVPNERYQALLQRPLPAFFA